MITMAEYDLEEANKHTLFHREELLQSESCGCFRCLAIFAPADIKEWEYEREGVYTTALCPNCGFDAVVGSASGYPINDDFLMQMHTRWFDQPFSR